MITTFTLLLEQAEDLKLILPKFDEYMYLSELKLWLPDYTNTLDMFDENATVSELSFNVELLLEKSKTI